jgi:hypothetical protein
MPITWKRRLRMFARWPGLAIHDATILRGVECLLRPHAMFSPTTQLSRPSIQPVRAIRALNPAPERES